MTEKKKKNEPEFAKKGGAFACLFRMKAAAFLGNAMKSPGNASRLAEKIAAGIFRALENFPGHKMDFLDRLSEAGASEDTLANCLGERGVGGLLRDRWLWDRDNMAPPIDKYFGLVCLGDPSDALKMFGSFREGARPEISSLAREALQKVVDAEEESDWLRRFREAGLASSQNGAADGAGLSKNELRASADHLAMLRWLADEGFIKRPGLARWAAESTYADAVFGVALLGADVNEAGDDGKTPLQALAARGERFAPACFALLLSGADGASAAPGCPPPLDVLSAPIRESGNKNLLALLEAWEMEKTLQAGCAPSDRVRRGL